MAASPSAVPTNLLLALSNSSQQSQSQSPRKRSPSPSFVASSAYVVSVSSRAQSPVPQSESRKSSDTIERMHGPTPLIMQERHSEDTNTRTSEDVPTSSNPNRESRLQAVSEAGSAEIPIYYRRQSDALTFGGGGQGSSPEPSASEQLSPVGGAGRFSVAKSDALRRQSLLTGSGRQSRDGTEGRSDVDGKASSSLSEKRELEHARPSYDDGDADTGPVSGSYRLTLKTDNESTNGYTGYGSSTGHSEPYIKKNQPHIPRSSYYVGPPSAGSAFGTEPMGEIGVHFPREIVRIERDYSGGELVQFYPTYPLEFEGRITPTKFQASVNEINEILISAYSLRWSALESALGVMTLYISTFFIETHYDREMLRLAKLFEKLNKDVFNPVGLSLLWPRKQAFLFLEIEYY